MNDTQVAASSFAAVFSDHLRDRALEITKKWLELLERRLVDTPSHRIFPSDSLLNHIPVVLASMADYVKVDADAINGNFVVNDLEAMADLRRQQGYSIEEILTEFDILSQLLFNEIRACAADLTESKDLVVNPAQLIGVIERLHEALRKVTATTVLGYSESVVRDQRSRAAMLQRFGDVISHEVRNRVNFAHLSVETWRRTHPPRDQEEIDLLRALGTVFEDLGYLTDDIRALSVAQIISEENWGRRRTLKQIIERLVDAGSSLAGVRDIELEVDDDLPELPVDAGRLELALGNMIINAFRYSDPTVDRKLVKVHAAETENGGCTISIVDNGIGIPVELREAIFEEGTRGQEETGSGLGLAIARQAIQQLGGTIQVDENDIGGSTFTINLPAPPKKLIA